MDGGGWWTKTARPSRRWAGGQMDESTSVEACLKQIANYAFTRTKYQSFGVITNFYFKPEQHMICYISFNQLKFERKVYLYRGVTHQSETFGFKLTHIRVKHFHVLNSVLVFQHIASTN